MVHVYDHERERDIVAPGTGEFLVHSFGKISIIGETREFVSASLGFQLCNGLSMLKDQFCLVHQKLELVDVILAPLFLILAIDSNQR